MGPRVCNAPVPTPRRARRDTAELAPGPAGGEEEEQVRRFGVRRVQPEVAKVDLVVFRDRFRGYCPSDHYCQVDSQAQAKVSSPGRVHCCPP